MLCLYLYFLLGRTTIVYIYSLVLCYNHRCVCVCVCVCRSTFGGGNTNCRLRSCVTRLSSKSTSERRWLTVVGSCTAARWQGRCRRPATGSSSGCGRPASTGCQASRSSSRSSHTVLQSIDLIDSSCILQYIFFNVLLMLLLF